MDKGNHCDPKIHVTTVNLVTKGSTCTCSYTSLSSDVMLHEETMYMYMHMYMYYRAKVKAVLVMV